MAEDEFLEVVSKEKALEAIKPALVSAFQNIHGRKTEDKKVAPIGRPDQIAIRLVVKADGSIRDVGPNPFNKDEKPILVMTGQQVSELAAVGNAKLYSKNDGDYRDKAFGQQFPLVTTEMAEIIGKAIDKTARFKDGNTQTFGEAYEAVFKPVKEEYEKTWKGDLPDNLVFDTAKFSKVPAFTATGDGLADAINKNIKVLKDRGIDVSDTMAKALRDNAKSLNSQLRDALQKELEKDNNPSQAAKVLEVIEKNTNQKGKVELKDFMELIKKARTGPDKKLSASLTIPAETVLGLEGLRESLKGIDTSWQNASVSTSTLPQPEDTGRAKPASRDL